MGTIKGGYNWLGAKIGGNSVNGIVKGGNVIYRKIDPTLILDLPLQSDFIDRTGLNTIVARSGSSLPSFVDGAVNFDGTRQLKTVGNLILNTTNKATIAYDLKVSSTSVVYIFVYGYNAFGGNSFSSLINDGVSNSVSLTSSGSAGLNIRVSSISYGEFTRYVFTINRDLLAGNQIKIYKNKVENSVVRAGFTASNPENFINENIYIGSNANGNSPFIGQLKNLKIWNRILTQTEIDNL